MKDCEIMKNNCTVGDIFSCLTICVLGILVYENVRFGKTTKYRFYLTYALIIAVALSERLGIARKEKCFESCFGICGS